MQNHGGGPPRVNVSVKTRKKSKGHGIELRKGKRGGLNSVISQKYIPLAAKMEKKRWGTVEENRGLNHKPTTPHQEKKLSNKKKLKQNKRREKKAYRWYQKLRTTQGS